MSIFDLEDSKDDDEDWNNGQDDWNDDGGDEDERVIPRTNWRE